MSFPFVIDTTIPGANNDPEDDQPLMLSNYQNIAGFLAVDHVPAGTNTSTLKAGFHAKVTYSTPLTVQTVSDLFSIAYSMLGVTDTTHPQNVFTNSIGTFPMTAIRAFGQFTTQPPNLTPPNFIPPASPIRTYNVANISHPNFNDYNVILNSNVVTGNSPIVLITLSNNSLFSTMTYTFSSGTLKITIPAAPDNILVNFAVLQF